MSNNERLLFGLCLGLCAGKAVADSGNVAAYHAGRHDALHRQGMAHTHAHYAVTVTEDCAEDMIHVSVPGRMLPLLVMRV
jgi:hypothetical protein